MAQLFFMKMGRVPRFALNFAIEGEADTANGGRNVRYWHLADNPTASAFVRFWTTADKGGFWPGTYDHLGHPASTASVRLGVARTVKRRPFAMWGHMVAAPSQ